MASPLPTTFGSKCLESSRYSCCTDFQQQRIVEEAMKVANGFSDEIKETYLQEASKIRLPRVKPLLRCPSGKRSTVNVVSMLIQVLGLSDANLPEIVNQRNIDINLPTANSNELVPVKVPNILYSYKFKDGYRRERDFSIIRTPEVISSAVIRHQNGRSLLDT